MIVEEEVIELQGDDNWFADLCKASHAAIDKVRRAYVEKMAELRALEEEYNHDD